MKKLLFSVLLLGLFVSACSPASESQGKNPKTADVAIEDGVVTIRISTNTPYFHLEKVSDDSVEYSNIDFKYDSESDMYLIRTDMEDWQPYPDSEDPVQMGKLTITVKKDVITINYPSGTWAFP